MTTTDIALRVKRIPSLNGTKVGKLLVDGIKTKEDLGYLKFIDYNAGILIVKRRKLDLIS